MKTVLTAACVFVLMGAVFALPVADQVPEKAFLLSASTGVAGTSKFEKALAEKGFDPAKASEDYPAEVKAFFKEAGFDPQKDIGSTAFCLTINPDKAVNGALSYLDGSFDAVKLMQALLNQKEVKKLVAASKDEVSLAVVKAGIGDGLQLTIKKNCWMIPFDIVLKAGAVAPHTILIGDKANFDFAAAAYAGAKPGPALDPKSALASVLAAGANSGRVYAEDFGPVLRATVKVIGDAYAACRGVEPSDPEPNAMVDPFFAVTALSGVTGEAEDGGKAFGDLVFSFTNEADAVAMQEVLLGYKAMIGIFAGQAGIPATLSSLVGAVRASQDGLKAKLSFSITPDQFIEFQKMLSEMGAGSPPAMAEALEADVEDDDDDDIDAISEAEARKLLEEALKK